jgi:environmental stress-induced protein Ves
VLEGEGVSLHFSGEQAADVTLKPSDAPLHFDGALAPGCTLLDGPTQDLNLMTRSGRSTMQTAQATEAWRPTYTVSALYTSCAGEWRSSLAHAFNGVEAEIVSVPLKAHSLLWCVAENASALWTFTPGTAGARAWWLGYTPDAP